MTFLEEKFQGLEADARTVLVGLLAVVISFTIFTLLQITNKSRTRIKSVPGWPLIGQLPEIIKRPNLAELFEKWFDHCGNEGIFSYFNALGPTRIAVFSGQFIKQILVRKSTKFRRVDDIAKSLPSLKDGILTSHGFSHSWQRKMMNPLFSISSMKNYVGLFHKHALDLVKCWEKKCNMNSSNSVEMTVQDDVRRFALDVIGDVAFGYDFNSLLKGHDELSEAFRIMLETKFEMGYRLKRRFIPFYDYLPLKSNIAFKKSIELTNSVIEELIRQKREKLAAGDRDTDGKTPDLLTVMIMAQDKDTGERMTEELLKQNSFTILLGGNDTTSLGLTWTLYHLARNIEVQEKARKEALNVLGNVEKITAEMISNLEYVNNVIKESLRMTPPVAFIARSNPLAEMLGQYEIPKHSFFVLPIVGIHNYPKFWANPENFNPDRFNNTDDPKSSGIPGQTYLPFGSGPRNCLGSKFATMSITIALATLLTKFKFNIRHDHPEVKGRFIFTFKPSPSPSLQVSLL